MCKKSFRGDVRGIIALCGAILIGLPTAFGDEPAESAWDFETWMSHATSPEREQQRLARKMLRVFRIETDSDGEVVSIFACGRQITDTVLRDFASLPKLQELKLAQAMITDQGLESLREAAALRKLAIRGGNLTDAAFKQIGALEDLELLHFGKVRSGSSLAELQSLVNLKELEVTIDADSDAAASHIGKLRGLEVLKLSAKGMSDDGLKHLVLLSNLRHLRLSSDKITDAGIAQLGRWKRLESLALNCEQVSGVVFQQIGHLGNLRTLVVYDTAPGDEDLKALAPLDELVQLNIRAGGLTATGYASLADLGALRELSLGRARITPECVDQLLRLDKLEKLWVDHARISPLQSRRLVDGIPDCRIENSIR